MYYKLLERDRGRDMRSSVLILESTDMLFRNQLPEVEAFIFSPERSAEQIAFGGLRVLKSRLIKDEQVPIRKHRRSKGSTRYHLRIQKKWNKRFGTKTVKPAYLINPEYLRSYKLSIPEES